MALGGYEAEQGGTAGNHAIRLLLNGNDFYTNRIQAMTKGSYMQLGPVFMGSMFSASSAYLLTLQYSAAQAATIYDRQLILRWG